MLNEIIIVIIKMIIENHVELIIPPRVLGAWERFRLLRGWRKRFLVIGVYYLERE